MTQLPSEASLSLASQIDSLTADSLTGAPGLLFVVVVKTGDYLFQHSSGTQGIGIDRPMSSDSVFWFASCTKMLTGTAAMQLVEKGTLRLDDADLVEKLAPELKDVKVLNDDGKIVPKERRITLKMLLNHTAGFGYTFVNPKLRAWGGPLGLDEYSLNAFEYMEAPLVNQPGSKFEYGINLDWAGILIERASGLKLDDYFQTNIFQPLNLKHMTMFPTEEMKRELVSMSMLNADGHLVNKILHPFRRPLVAKSRIEVDAIFHSGGGGCFGRPTEYAQVIAALLNDGVHHKTGHRLLSKESVDMMFSNSAPDRKGSQRQTLEWNRREGLGFRSA